MQNWLVRVARMGAKRSSNNTTTAAYRARSAGSKLRLEELEGRLVLSAYYVSPSGSDTSNGTSTTTPWKTITRVNSAELKPGDSVNFLGGATFTSPTALTFTNPKDNGSPANPILITSYGTGRATLSTTGNTGGIEGQHVSGYRITNLIVKGSGWANNSKNGINFFAWSSGNLEHLHIDNVEVSGFGKSGILIQASNNVSTFRDIRVTNSNLSGNAFAGFETIGPGAGGNHTPRTIFDVYLSDLKIYNNAGISLGSVYGGLVERSVSANNGYTGDVATGIFVYDSSYITVRNNEFYGMENYGTNTDGNGINIDYGADHCIVEGNYTHDNIGAGIQLAGSNQPGLPHNSFNIVRYNISENDATKYTFGAISVYRGVSNAEIYGNTVYNTKRDAFQLWDWKGSSVHVRNNIFMTAGGATQYIVNAFVPNNPNQKLSDLDLVFQGNNYYASGASFKIHYGDDFYFSLSDWRNATGQEKLFGNAVGSSVNPQLFNPGGGGNIGNPDLLDTFTAYQLRPRSRLANWGLNLSGLFGINPGERDFFNNLLPSGLAIAVGAHDPRDDGRGANDSSGNGMGELSGDIAALSEHTLSLNIDEGSPLIMQSISNRQVVNPPAQTVQVIVEETETNVTPIRPMLQRRVHEPVLAEVVGDLEENPGV